MSHYNCYYFNIKVFSCCCFLCSLLLLCLFRCFFPLQDGLNSLSVHCLDSLDPAQILRTNILLPQDPRGSVTCSSCHYPGSRSKSGGRGWAVLGEHVFIQETWQQNLRKVCGGLCPKATKLAFSSGLGFFSTLTNFVSQHPWEGKCVFCSLINTRGNQDIKTPAWQREAPGTSQPLLAVPTTTSSQNLLPSQTMKFWECCFCERTEDLSPASIFKELFLCSSPAYAWPWHCYCSLYFYGIFKEDPHGVNEMFLPHFAATREEELCHVPRFALEVFGGDLCPSSCCHQWPPLLDIPGSAAVSSPSGGKKQCHPSAFYHKSCHIYMYLF